MSGGAEFLLAAMSGLGIAGVMFLHLMDVRGFRRSPAEVQAVFGAAATEMNRRGHGTLSSDHVALAVLAVPEVTHAMRTNGIVIEKLRAELETHLAPVERTRKGYRLSADYVAVVRAVRGRATRDGTKPGAALEAIVRAIVTKGRGFARDAFLARGIDAAWSLAGPRRRASGAETEVDAASEPYRADATPVKARVVFWNDDKSPMEGVIAILKDVFVMSDAEATYVMLLVHHGGIATARICDEEEAATLAEQATRAARARGMPTRITAEPLAARTAKVG
jgi:ATP-dependent Clp protease adaptor protein ClpS